MKVLLFQCLCCFKKHNAKKCSFLFVVIFFALVHVQDIPQVMVDVSESKTIHPRVNGIGFSQEGSSSVLHFLGNFIDCFFGFGIERDEEIAVVVHALGVLTCELVEHVVVEKHQSHVVFAQDDAGAAICRGVVLVDFKTYLFEKFTREINVIDWDIEPEFAVVHNGLIFYK
jgi:hypothetical protein